MTTWLERFAPKSRIPRRDSMIATAGNCGKIDVDSPIELELIEQRLRRRGRGITVLELEVAEPSLNRLRADPAMQSRQARFSPARIETPTSPTCV